MCWGSQWAAAAPGEETYLAFFGRRSPWRKPTWLFLGALGRTTGFFGARGGLLWGEPTWLFGSPHRGFWGVRRTLPQRFGAFTWCLHLVPSPERAVVGAALQRISPPGNPVLSRRHDFLESSA